MTGISIGTSIFRVPRAVKAIAAAVLLMAALALVVGVWSQPALAFSSVEQSDARISYSGSWATFSVASASGGSYKRANTLGASVTIPFNGTSLTWVATKGVTMGKADVSVDGGDPVTIDLSATSATYQQEVFSTGELRSGYHWVEISWNPENETGKYINVDAVKVDDVLVSTVRVEQTSSGLSWTGSWTNGSSSSYSGGSFKYTNTSGSSSTIKFTGVRVSLIAKKAASYGIARVRLDGGEPISVDLYSSSTSYKQTVWSSGFIAPGSHTVTVEWTGTKRSAATNTNVSIDAFDVAGVLPQVTAPGSTGVYYVDASGGNDDNNGLSPETAWQTLTKVKRNFSAGDTILFKRGEVWRGQLTAVASGTSSAYITYGPYGDESLPNPLILGSVDLSSATKWVSQGSNVWRASTIDKDVGNLILNNEASVGHKKTTRSSMTRQGDFYYNPTSKYVELYSTSNPGSFYSHIEAAKKQHGFYSGAANYIRVHDLSFKYQGAHGAQINSQGTHHVIIEHCSFAWIGGSYWYDTTRYGNGIEIYESCNNITVRYNKVDNAFDEGITAQGFYNPSTVNNIYIYGNTVTRCKAGISAYYHTGPSTVSNINICHNVIYNTGAGWSDSINVRCGFYSSGFQNTKVTNCRFSNNIIHTSVGQALLVWKPVSQVAPGWTFDYNCYYPDSAAAFEHDASHLVNFATWKSLTVQDAHSTVSDPKFVDAAHGDFRLASGSPCIQTGVAVPNVGQTAGVRPNMGASY